MTSEAQVQGNSRRRDCLPCLCRAKLRCTPRNDREAIVRNKANLPSGFPLKKETILLHLRALCASVVKIQNKANSPAGIAAHVSDRVEGSVTSNLTPPGEAAPPVCEPSVRNKANLQKQVRVLRPAWERVYGSYGQPSGCVKTKPIPRPGSLSVPPSRSRAGSLRIEHRRGWRCQMARGSSVRNKANWASGLLLERETILLHLRGEDSKQSQFGKGFKSEASSVKWEEPSIEPCKTKPIATSRDE